MEIGEIPIRPSTAPAQLLIFSFLRTLRISGCDKMRKLGLPLLALPNLEDLRIEECGKIEEIFEEDERSSILTTLPILRHLYLSSLPSVRMVGLPASRLPYLESVEIRELPDIEEIFEDDEGRAGSIVTTLPYLRVLRLAWLPS